MNQISSARLALATSLYLGAMCCFAADTNKVGSVTFSRSETEERLNQIPIGSIKVDAVPLEDAVHFIKAEIAKNPMGKGIEIVIELNPKIPDLIIPTNLTQQVRAEALNLLKRHQRKPEQVQPSLTNKVTLNLREIPAYDVLRLIGQLGNMETSIESNRFIFGHGCLQKEVRVEECLQDLSGESKTNKVVDLTRFFQDAGVQVLAEWLRDERLMIFIGTKEDFEILDRVR